MDELNITLACSLVDGCCAACGKKINNNIEEARFQCEEATVDFLICNECKYGGD